MPVNSDDNLRQLMVKAQNGDKTAYHTLLTHLRKIILGYTRKKVFNQDLAEDVVQDVLMAIHKARHTYRPEKPFKPWMNAIICYKTIDAFRKIGRDREDEAAEAEDIETFYPDSANKQLQAMERHDLVKALKTLPDKQQKVVVLMKVNGLSVKEVSKLLSLSPSAVKVTAHRAYKSLKIILEEEKSY